MCIEYTDVATPVCTVATFCCTIGFIILKVVVTGIRDIGAPPLLAFSIAWTTACLLPVQ